MTENSVKHVVHMYVTWKLMLQVIRIVRFCSAFSLPIVSVLLPCRDGSAEQRASVQDLANLIFVYSEAAVPKIAVLCTPQAITAEKVPGLLMCCPCYLPSSFAEVNRRMSVACTLTGRCVNLRLGILQLQASQRCCSRYGSAACKAHTLAAERLAILPRC